MGDVTGGSAKMSFTNREVWHTTQLGCPDFRRTHAHYTLTPALLDKPPDGPIPGQDVCFDYSTDSEPESPEPARHGQVVADGKPSLLFLPPPSEAIVVHPITLTANHTAEPPDSSGAPKHTCQRPRGWNDD